MAIKSGVQVTIPEANISCVNNEIITAKLNHEQNFCVTFANLNDFHVYALLYIQGKSMMVMKNNKKIRMELDPNEVGIMDSPLYSSGKFTYYELNSEQAICSGLENIDKNELGIVKVEIYFPRQSEGRNTIPASISKGATRSIGGVGLSGYEGEDYNIVQGSGITYKKMPEFEFKFKLQTANEEIRPL